MTIADDFSSNGIKTDAINLENYDAAVVSPGWKLDHPLLAKVLSSDLEVLNEVDLAWQLKLEVAPHQKWLAVTGTNGKTTTVEMLAKILQTAGLPTLTTKPTSAAQQLQRVLATKKAPSKSTLVIHLGNPRLKHQHRPQAGRVIALATQMFSPLLSNRCRVKVALAL